MALFRELLSRKVDESANRAPIVSPPTADLVQRSGYMSGIPIGGAIEISPGQSAGGDSIDRASFMQQMLQAYLSCQWSSACVDVIARTCTAGGIDAIPISASLESDKVPDMPPAVREVMDLLMFVNPYDDIRQLMRGAITDSLVYGDSFTEVVWLMGKPVSLWPLDPATMTILSDEHGILRGYHQSMPTGREVTFAPHEVIHVKFDSPGGGLYGLSPTQKNILPITSWLFTAALVKETMKRGDPIRAHVDWPLALPPSEMKRFQEQFQVRNLGARNIGNLFETKGGAHVQELGANQVKNWLDVLQQRRDEILCLLPETLILTQTGMVPIKDITEGTLVMSHLGRWQPVLATQSRPVYTDVVEVSANSFDPIRSTSNHPFYAARYSQSRSHKFEFEDFGWVDAGLLTSRVRNARGQSHAVTLPGFQYGDGVLRVAEHVSLGTSNASLGTVTQSAWDDGTMIRHSSSRVNPIPSEIKMDHQLGRLLGLYLAEGSIGNSSAVQWSFANDEENLRQEVREALSEKFLLDTRSEERRVG